MRGSLKQRSKGSWPQKRLKTELAAARAEVKRLRRQHAALERKLAQILPLLPDPVDARLLAHYRALPRSEKQFISWMLKRMRSRP